MEPSSPSWSVFSNMLSSPCGQLLPIIVILHLVAAANPNPTSVKVAVPQQDITNYKGSGCMNHVYHRGSEAAPCKCRPCWDGHLCQKYVDRYVPKFLVRESTVVLTSNVTGIVYYALATDADLGLTCPLGTSDAPATCPCASINFQLFAQPGDNRFTIDSSTGILSRSEEGVLWEGYTYHYRIIVHSLADLSLPSALRYDIQDLYIYVARGDA